MTVFTAVAEEGGFSSAARRLHTSASAVTRAIASLEERLGTQLLTRTTRIVKLNETGKNYLSHAKRILAKLEAADETAVGINSTPCGMLAVTCPTNFGRRFIVPCVVDYLNRYPDAQAKCIFLDRTANLVEEGFDVGIRFGALADSNMRATRVGKYSDVVCGSPSYLAKHGRPKTPADLSDHALVCFAGNHSLWRFSKNNMMMPVRIRPRATLTTVDAAVEVARRGLGLVQLPSYQVADHLANGKLEIVLDEYEIPPHPIHIVYGGSYSQSATVRIFIDLLATYLRSTAVLQLKRSNPYG